MTKFKKGDQIFENGQIYKIEDDTLTIIAVDNEVFDSGFDDDEDITVIHINDSHESVFETIKSQGLNIYFVSNVSFEVKEKLDCFHVPMISDWDVFVNWDPWDKKPHKIPCPIISNLDLKEHRIGWGSEANQGRSCATLFCGEIIFSGSNLKMESLSIPHKEENRYDVVPTINNSKMLFNDVVLYDESITEKNCKNLKFLTKQLKKIDALKEGYVFNNVQLWGDRNVHTELLWDENLQGYTLK